MLASIGLALAGAALLFVALRALRNALAGGNAPLQAELVTVPLLPEQRLELPSGRVTMSVEGRSFTQDFVGLAYGLFRLPGGEKVPGRPIVFRFKRSGLTTTRLELCSYDLPATGAYVLQVEGSAQQKIDPSSRLVFARRVDVLRLVAMIAGLVSGGGMLVAAIVQVAWLLR